MASTLGSVPARPSATTLVLRPGTPLQTFLVKRVKTQRFMGGAHVFPGGALDESDWDVVKQDLIEHSHAPALADQMHLSEQEALAHVAAAARELLEEAGVLLCRGVEAAEARELRAAVLEGASMAELLHENAMVLDGDALTYVAHWITPLGEPKRYDTRFFVTLLPEGQEATADEQEAMESSWFTPAQAVAAHVERQINLPPPTLCMLDWLSRKSSAHDALKAIKGSVPAILPELHTLDDRLVITFPGDPAHSQEKGMPGAYTRVEMRNGVWIPFRVNRELKV